MASSSETVSGCFSIVFSYLIMIKQARHEALPRALKFTVKGNEPFLEPSQNVPSVPRTVQLVVLESAPCNDDAPSVVLKQ